MHKKTQFIRRKELDQQLGVEVIFASELQQHTHSFKFRAAWNVVDNIDAKGFLAASSGNFGQALAYAAHLKGRRCIIVMPDNSAKVKIDAVRSYQAQVELIDTTKKSRAQRVAELAKEHPDFYVASAYDCEHVIQGNSSLGIEIAKQNFAADMILAPIGGGGLSSGIVVGMTRQGDDTPVWGAEPALADDAIRSLQAGRLLRNIQEPQTIADGARTVSLGERNWQILRTGLAGILSVTESSIHQAMRLFHTQGLRVEPTGSVTLGAIIEHRERLEGKRVVAVISGGNVDDAVLARVLE